MNTIEEFNPQKVRLVDESTETRSSGGPPDVDGGESVYTLLYGQNEIWAVRSRYCWGFSGSTGAAVTAILSEDKATMTVRTRPQSPGQPEDEKTYAIHVDRVEPIATQPRPEWTKHVDGAGKTYWEHETRRITWDDPACGTVKWVAGIGLPPPDHKGWWGAVHYPLPAENN